MSVVIRLKVPIEMHYTVIPMGTSKVNSSQQMFSILLLYYSLTPNWKFTSEHLPYVMITGWVSPGNWLGHWSLSDVLWMKKTLFDVSAESDFVFFQLCP